MFEIGSNDKPDILIFFKGKQAPILFELFLIFYNVRRLSIYSCKQFNCVHGIVMIRLQMFALSVCIIRIYMSFKRCYVVLVLLC